MEKKIIITGASSGIGLAAANKLLEEGHQVIGLARRKNKMLPLQEQYSNQFFPVDLDITDTKAVLKFSDEHGKGTNVLINNAGVGMLGPITEQQLDQWHTMFDVNVKGLLSITHALLPELRSRKGQIINIDSVAGHEVFPEATVYCASKWAVKAISIGLDKELRGEVKVTNISPGAVETEFIDHTTHPTKSEQMEQAFKNVLKPEDIASAISHALNAPDHVAINEITIRPFK